MNQFLKKKVLVIGLTWEQWPYVSFLHDNGAVLFGVNSDKKTVVDEAFFEEICVCSYDNFTQILEFSHLHKIEGIISDECDYAYLAQAYVSCAMNLPGPSIKNCRLFTNKAEQREVFSHYSPHYKIIKNYNELHSSIKDGERKVLKPVDSRGSFGVEVIINKASLYNKYLNALSCSPSKTLILEDYIDGEHYNIDVFVNEQDYTILGVSKNSKLREGVINEYLIYDESLIKEEFSDLVSYIVTQSGVTFGFLHIEAIESSANVYLTEVSNRGAGINISNILLPFHCGLDLVKSYVNACLGCGSIDMKIDNRKSAAITFLEIEDCGKRLKTIKCVKDDHVIFWKSFLEIGQLIPEIVNGASRHIMVMHIGDKNVSINNYLIEAE